MAWCRMVLWHSSEGIITKIPTSKTCLKTAISKSYPDSPRDQRVKVPQSPSHQSGTLLTSMSRGICKRGVPTAARRLTEARGRLELGLSTSIMTRAVISSAGTWIAAWKINSSSNSKSLILQTFEVVTCNYEFKIYHYEWNILIFIWNITGLKWLMPGTTPSSINRWDKMKCWILGHFCIKWS